MGKSNWFKKKNQKGKYTFPSKPEKKQRSKPKSKDIETVTVMFVNQTPNGELAKRLQKAENEISKFTGERVRICERGGKTMEELVEGRIVFPVSMVMGNKIVLSRIVSMT